MESKRDDGGDGDNHRVASHHIKRRGIQFIWLGVSDELPFVRDFDDEGSVREKGLLALY